MLAACSQFFHKFFQDFTQEPLVEIEGRSARRVGSWESGGIRVLLEQEGFLPNLLHRAGV